MKHFKKITSLTLGISFIVMSFTGIMLYIVPQGKVAHWSEWSMLGMTKDDYGNLHITTTVVFLFFALFHIYYNWKPLLSYMKNQSKKISFVKEEFLIALALNLFFVIGTFYMIQPAKAILDLNQDIKSYWAKTSGEPPYGHAEESSLKVFCRKEGIDLEEAKRKLDEKDIRYTISQSLMEIAKNNHTTPQALYMIIKGDKKRSLSTRSGGTITNLGRKTLQELSDLKVIDLAKSMETIKTSGYQDVTKDTRMKIIADELGTTPLELFKKIEKK